MRVHRLVFVLVASAGVLTPSPSPARADAASTTTRAPDDRARFRGSFRFTGSSREEAARVAAIDLAIDSLVFPLRGIARSRLSGATKIEPWVSFSFDAANIRVRVPSAKEAISPENGAAVDYENDGNRMKLSQRMSGAKLTQAFVREQGRRVNEWTLSADGRQLLLKVTLSSPRLSRPIVYTATYERSL